MPARMLPPIAEAGEEPRLRKSELSPSAAASSSVGVQAALSDGIAAEPMPVPIPATVVPTKMLLNEAAMGAVAVIAPA